MGWLLFWAGVLVLLAVVAYLPRSRQRATDADASEALRDQERDYEGERVWKALPPRVMGLGGPPPDAFRFRRFPPGADRRQGRDPAP